MNLRLKILPQPLAVHALAYANVTFLEYYKVNNDGFIPTGCIVTANNKTRQNCFFIDGMTSLDRYFTVPFAVLLNFLVENMLLSHIRVSMHFPFLKILDFLLSINRFYTKGKE